MVYFDNRPWSGIWLLIPVVFGWEYSACFVRRAELRYLVGNAVVATVEGFGRTLGRD